MYALDSFILGALVGWIAHALYEFMLKPIMYSINNCTGNCRQGRDCDCREPNKDR